MTEPARLVEHDTNDVFGGMRIRHKVCDCAIERRDAPAMAKRHSQQMRIGDLPVTV